MTEPLRVSRMRARERRSLFAAEAASVAAAAGLPARPHQTSLPLPAGPVTRHRSGKPAGLAGLRSDQT